MSLLSALASDSSIAAEKDSVGGSSTLESGLYPCTVTMAYLNKAASGALGLVLNLKTPSNQEVRQTLWMTSGTAKGGKNYYEKDGEKHFLPGFNHANGLCLLALGKEVSAMDTEVKVVKLYSSEAKAEVPTKVDVLTDLLGKEVLVGLIKQTLDKTMKTSEGTYIPAFKVDEQKRPVLNDKGGFIFTGETRDENEIDKLFRAADRLTTAEIRAQATEASFANTWETKWAGKTRNKAKGAAAGGGTSGMPAMAGAAASKKPATSLFG